ncbi:exodeoxyribonuclease V subunit gamma [Desulforhopalus vacuolatus]|uniref:exodeoxyribonuclease V subunit gamma n=1 Tax=Desulforhopalus vacuolatus TaxID=40414 RepID=UPI001964ED02|nr:exodeoxyribonuclease V subunit gamma [Desulforhopalus vacuolatus]MBM9518693.1 exodeoxyribonuclease V subunit gamma [Desulforhopalus vacuolatus]
MTHGFFLHASNRTEDLLEHLAAVLQSAPQKSLFGTEMFLIQSQGMGRVVSQNLADRFGSFCNFRFYLPLNFLCHIANLLDLDISPDGFDRGILTWRLEALLRDCDGEKYKPLHRYLHGDEPSHRRYQLARRIADTFDQYQLMRSKMVLDWEEERATFPDGPEAVDEEWQMALWRRLVDQPEGGAHRALLFQRVIDFLNKSGEGELSARLPQRVSIFGVHTLPPRFLEYLATLSRQINVHLYLLSPCQGYWGDMTGEKKVLRTALKTGLDVAEGEGGHPLLADLGRQGRDLQEIMLEDIDFTLEITSWHDPLENAAEGSSLLLEQVQHDILKGKVTPARLAADDSIRVISTYSRWRELEVLHDHLLQFFEDDPSLTLRDIVVMAPDIQHYAALIPAAFNDIQYSVADRSLQWRNPAIAAFSLFLDLFKGRFGRSEVMELLQHRFIAGRFELNEKDVEEVTRWTEEAGIRWGLSVQQRSELGLDFSEATFRSGLDRLLMGFMIDSDNFVDGVLPWPDLEGRGASALGGLCQFFAVIERAEAEFHDPRSLTAWSTLLLDTMENLLTDTGAGEVGELRTLLVGLAESEPFTGEQDVDFTVICEWFNDCTAESSSSVGFPGGRLTFCSMLPMRSIPFKAICLLGLDDGVFPRTDRADSFSLIAAAPRPGDRSPRNDDRYQFLEAILAARRVLYLSYIGLSEQNGDVLPPSVVVSEFLDLLSRSYGVADIVCEHPLYSFSERYFDDSSSAFFSYSGHNLAVAQARQEAWREKQVSLETAPSPQRVDEVSPFGWWRGEVEQDEAESISVGELFNFYKNPPAWFVNNVLGIRPDTGDVQRDDRESFSLNFLEKARVNRVLFDEMIVAGGALKETAEESLLHRLQSQSLWPLGTSGRLNFAEQQQEVLTYVERLQALNLGDPQPEKFLDIPSTPATDNLALGGTLTDFFAGGNLQLRFGKLRGKDLLRGWLYHQLSCLAGLSGETWLLAADVTLHFNGDMTKDDGGLNPGITSLLRLWREGRRRPLCALVEPAFDWAVKAVKKGIGMEAAAQSKLERDLEYLYEPELALLIGEGEPAALLDEEFEQFAEKVMVPVYKAGMEGA